MWVNTADFVISWLPSTIADQNLGRSFREHKVCNRHSFPSSLTPKLLLITYVNVLIFTLPHHRELPFERWAPHLLCQQPHALSHHGDDKVTDLKVEYQQGEIWPRTPWAFPFCFLVLGFSSSWAAGFALITFMVTRQRFFIFLAKIYFIINLQWKSAQRITATVRLS